MSSPIVMLRSMGRVTRRALNRVWFLIILVLIVHFVAGLLYSTFEHKSFRDGQWWATITGTTVGYGDFYPVSEEGRLMTSVYVSIMLILTAFITGHIFSAVIEDRNLFSHNEQERIKMALLFQGQKDGFYDAEMTELPSLQWYREHGLQEESPDDTTT